MIPIQHRIGGRMAVETGKADTAGHTHVWAHGDGRIIKQPAALTPLLDRVASGEPFTLNDDERGYLKNMRIDVVETDEVRKAEALKDYAAGLSPALINSRPSFPYYRATLPVKFITAFRAAH